MDTKKEIPEIIKFVYKEANDYKSIYVNGAHGGITARGDIKFDLFQEYLPHPEAEIRRVNDEGGLGEEIKEIQNEKIFIRELKVGITMSILQAKSLASWLNKRIVEMEKIIEKNKEGGDLDNDE